MTDCDTQVLEWLRGKAQELDDSGVTRLCSEVVSRSWRRNADRYDPSAGDTPRSLGMDQSENLRELMLREYRDRRESWAARGVEVSDPEQSLLVRAAGLALHPMKARNNTQQQPDWNAFRWSDKSLIRQEAARQNRRRYVPAFAPPLPGMETLGQDPAVLGHAMIVYCGDLGTGRTAGWVAVPSADAMGEESKNPWMAVVPLWWEEGDGVGRGSRSSGDDFPSSTTFDAQPTPRPTVTLKPARRPSES